MSTIPTTYHPGKDDERPIEVGYEFGANLTEFVGLFGEEVAYSYCSRQAIIALQNYVRAQCKAGKTDEEVQAAVAEWKPGMVVERAKKSAKQRALEAVDTMSPEDLSELIKKAKAKRDAKGI